MFSSALTASGFALSQDGLTAYISHKASSQYDIYVATRSKKGESFDSIALLDNSGREDPLLLSPDECTLYFMSNRDTGAAGTQAFRIYSATRSGS